MTETLYVVAAPFDADHPHNPGEERVVAIHRNSNPNGGDLMLRSGEPAIEVSNTTDIRRRIRAGDLVVSKPTAAKPITTPPAAPAPVSSGK